MGFFSPDTEADALRQIEKINSEMRAISALIHLNYNMIDGRNRTGIKQHLTNAFRYAAKYERIKQNLPELDRMMLMGATVNVWNGESVGVFKWEIYFENVTKQLCIDLDY